MLQAFNTSSATVLHTTAPQSVNSEQPQSGSSAWVSQDGEKKWYRNGTGKKSFFGLCYTGGELHREDGPAIESADGTKQWYRNGQRHREDGPAIERANGVTSWYLHGQQHREDGPALEAPDGTKQWYRNGQLHRGEGPAVVGPDGAKEWYCNGLRHREDGPAIERADGAKEWWRDGLSWPEGPAIAAAESARREADTARRMKEIRGLQLVSKAPVVAMKTVRFAARKLSA